MSAIWAQRSDSVDGRMASEVRHQEIIAASFDHAEAYERLGDFEHALEWLDRAAALSGGMPPAYRGRRARWARELSVRPHPGNGAWTSPLLPEQGGVAP